MEKQEILRLEQEIHKIRLEHLMPENKWFLENKSCHNVVGMLKGPRSQMKELPMAKAGII